jgi:hypothetical protein
MWRRISNSLKINTQSRERTPHIQGNYPQSLLPAHCSFLADFGKEVLKILASCSIALEIRRNDARDDIVAMIQNLSCKGDANRGVARG